MNSIGYVALVPAEVEEGGLSLRGPEVGSAIAGERTCSIFHRTTRGMLVRSVPSGKREAFGSGLFKVLHRSRSSSGDLLVCARPSSDHPSEDGLSPAARRHAFRKEVGILEILTAEGEQEGIVAYGGTYKTWSEGGTATEEMVMRDYHGGTLRDALETKNLTAADAKLILKKVAVGLSYAHSLGIMHHDIKGDNIFLVRDDKGTVTDAVLGDWGNAINMERLTRGHGLATPNMAVLPWAMQSYIHQLFDEGMTSRVRAQRVTANRDRHEAADVFSFGILARCLIEQTLETSDLLSRLAAYDYGERPRSYELAGLIDGLPEGAFTKLETEGLSLLAIRQEEKEKVLQLEKPSDVTYEGYVVDYGD